MRSHIFMLERSRKLHSINYMNIVNIVNIVNTVYPNGNKANFRVKTIYSGKRSIHFARWWTITTIIYYNLLSYFQIKNQHVDISNLQSFYAVLYLLYKNWKHILIRKKKSPIMDVGRDEYLGSNQWLS